MGKDSRQCLWKSFGMRTLFLQIRTFWFEAGSCGMTNYTRTRPNANCKSRCVTEKPTEVFARVEPKQHRPLQRTSCLKTVPNCSASIEDRRVLGLLYVKSY
ncbi:hypothetical protein AVEN_218656-1 [Araneus ventricosus]|uniref:Uncharacterized protein n=1 Tax=Araneus ventricosus TaxID=182803 RepID=A0A4Y2B3Y7_ARAVE|nr:hypothetical protein AVEN_218656-1 [Araneus ventricosus]